MLSAHGADHEAVATLRSGDDIDRIAVAADSHVEGSEKRVPNFAEVLVVRATIFTDIEYGRERFRTAHAAEGGIAALFRVNDGDGHSVARRRNSHRIGHLHGAAFGKVVLGGDDDRSRKRDSVVVA